MGSNVGAARSPRIGIVCVAIVDETEGCEEICEEEGGCNEGSTGDNKVEDEPMGEIGVLGRELIELGGVLKTGELVGGKGASKKSSELVEESGNNCENLTGAGLFTGNW